LTLSLRVAHACRSQQEQSESGTFSAQSDSLCAMPLQDLISKIHSSYFPLPFAYAHKAFNPVSYEYFDLTRRTCGLDSFKYVLCPRARYFICTE
jgi:hypothetical protein